MQKPTAEVVAEVIGLKALDHRETWQPQGYRLFLSPTVHASHAETVAKLERIPGWRFNRPTVDDHQESLLNKRHQEILAELGG